ncbi:hypothetical protein ACF0H5_016308 [Mactra antiquata]
MMATMKEFAVFALTVLAVTSPTLAGLRASCTNDAFCKDTSNGGDANAVCATAGQTCSCTGAYKANTGGTACVTKGLGDTCTDNAHCTNVAKATCKSSTCQCMNGYKTSGSTCTAVFGITCSAVGDCAGLDNAACTDSKCACHTDYGVKDNECKMKVSAMTCSNDSGCTTNVPNSQCVSSKCKCKDSYKENVNVCVLNGASGLAANIGILSSVLIILSYLIKL